MFQIFCALCQEQIDCDHGELDHLKKHIRKEHDTVKYKLDLVVALSFINAMEEKSLIELAEWKVERIQETCEMTCALCSDYIICKGGDMDPLKKHMRKEHDIVKYKMNLVLALCFLNTAGEKKLIEEVKERVELFMKTGEIIMTGIVFRSINVKNYFDTVSYMSKDILGTEHGEDSVLNERLFYDVLETVQKEEYTLLFGSQREEGECLDINKVAINDAVKEPNQKIKIENCQKEKTNQIFHNIKSFRGDKEKIPTIYDQIKVKEKAYNVEVNSGASFQNNETNLSSLDKSLTNNIEGIGGLIDEKEKHHLVRTVGELIKNKKKKSDKTMNYNNVKEKKKMGRPIRVYIDQFCQECGKEFTRRKHIVMVFKRHMLKHQVENFHCECPDVPTVYTRPDQERTGMDFRLKERHMKIVHLGWYGCDECKECFETDNQLAEHVKKHMITYVCDQCGFVAQNQDALRHHIKSIHESSPMLCTEPITTELNCSQVLDSKIALDRHIRKVHRSSACPICGLVLKNIKVHMLEQHMSDVDKKFHCKDCRKGFMDKQRLNVHTMNMHIKTQPHKCRFGCTNRYNSQSNRNAHEKRRHGCVQSKIIGTQLNPYI